jgi:hypothetical protein
VTEYLASGSLRAAITRKADFVTRDSVKIKLALDAARVSAPCALQSAKSGYVLTALCAQIKLECVLKSS